MNNLKNCRDIINMILHLPPHLEYLRFRIIEEFKKDNPSYILRWGKFMKMTLENDIPELYTDYVRVNDQSTIKVDIDINGFLWHYSNGKHVKAEKLIINGMKLKKIWKIESIDVLPKFEHPLLWAITTVKNSRFSSIITPKTFNFAKGIIDYYRKAFTINNTFENVEKHKKYYAIFNNTEILTSEAENIPNKSGIFPTPSNFFEEQLKEYWKNKVISEVKYGTASTRAVLGSTGSSIIDLSYKTR